MQSILGDYHQRNTIQLLAWTLQDHSLLSEYCSGLGIKRQKLATILCANISHVREKVNREVLAV